MRKNNFFRKMACTTAFLLSTSSASVALATNTEDFTGIAVFGDSFVATDNTWSAELTKKLGFTFKTNETNFAIGGHDSASLIGGTFNIPDVLITGSINYTSSDLNNYLLKNKFGQNELVVYYPLSSETAGLYSAISNNIAFAVNTVVAGIMDGGEGIPFGTYAFSSGNFNTDLDALSMTLDQTETKVLDGTLSFDKNNFPILFKFFSLTENNAQAFMEKAVANGANYILISNHFNENLRQNLVYGGTKDMEFAAVVSREMAKAQIRGAQRTGANLIVFDDTNLTQELCDNPGKYLTAEEQALGKFTSRDGKTGVFDSTSHPTTPVHKIISQQRFSVSTSPTLVSTLREIPLASGVKAANMNQALAQNFALTRQLQSDLAASSDTDSDRKFAVQVFGDFGKSKTGKFSKKDLGFTDDSSWDFGVGINYKATDNLVVGTNVSYSETKTKFEADRGNSKIKEKAVSLHGIYSFEQPVFVYGSAGYGKLNYDITRNIKLGLATHKENGTPSGDHFFGTLGTGYRFDVDKNISITPFVAGHYQSISMNTYTEEVDKKTSTAMSFNIPKRESIMAEIGATFAGKISAMENVALTPSLTVSYLYDWRNPLTQKVKARNLRTMDELEINYFKVPGYNVEKSTMKIQGSVIAEINNKYHVGVNASSRPLGRVKSWSVGIMSAIKL